MSLNTTKDIIDEAAEKQEPKKKRKRRRYDPSTDELLTYG